MPLVVQGALRSRPANIVPILAHSNGGVDVILLRKFCPPRFSRRLRLVGRVRPAEPVTAPVAAQYNPLGTALAPPPKTDVNWYHVMFATNGSRIDADGKMAISSAADASNRAVDIGIH